MFESGKVAPEARAEAGSVVVVKRGLLWSAHQKLHLCVQIHCLWKAHFIPILLMFWKQRISHYMSMYFHYNSYPCQFNRWHLRWNFNGHTSIIKGMKDALCWDIESYNIQLGIFICIMKKEAAPSQSIFQVTLHTTTLVEVADMQPNLRRS